MRALYGKSASDPSHLPHQQEQGLEGEHGARKDGAHPKLQLAEERALLELGHGDAVDDAHAQPHDGCRHAQPNGGDECAVHDGQHKLLVRQVHGVVGVLDGGQRAACLAVIVLQKVVQHDQHNKDSVHAGVQEEGGPEVQLLAQDPHPQQNQHGEGREVDEDGQLKEDVVHHHAGALKHVSGQHEEKDGAENAKDAKQHKQPQARVFQDGTPAVDPHAIPVHANTQQHATGCKQQVHGRTHIKNDKVLCVQLAVMVVFPGGHAQDGEHLHAVGGIDGSAHAHGG
eukprot:CAMPEP_0177658118 /NCGR_PEP_ID=MMETSP0447-20121125/16623_1 /TAXON_ID=0 /ORGANISM="Stygamoeba regulata, Strain BSH-02190019" /LENGTH=283 /DNA_ID=CAMNT_0019162669 /DNA_START=144 /DNA_END=991 /DNA_ORIENTATION=+